MRIGGSKVVYIPIEVCHKTLNVSQEQVNDKERALHNNVRDTFVFVIRLNSDGNVFTSSERLMVVIQPLVFYNRISH